MEFINLDKNATKQIIARLTKAELIEFLAFCQELIDFELKYKKYSFKLEAQSKRATAKKGDFIELFTKLLSDNHFKTQLYSKLTKTELSKHLYESLVWQKDFLFTQEVSKQYNYQFKAYNTQWYGSKIEKLPNNLFADNISLISRRVEFQYNKMTSDTLFIDTPTRELLKIIMPLPQNYYLSGIELLEKCDYHYNNEEGALEFVNAIYPMLQNNLVTFNIGRTKPLVKSLNILKQTSGTKEFYTDKKLNRLATDMLTRSLANYYWKNGHKFEQPPHNAIKHLMLAQFAGHLDFMISRVFLSHLKRVRFDNYYQSESEIFDLIKMLVAQMPQDAYVSMQNILDFCKYRDIEIDIDSKKKRYEYFMECDIVTQDGIISDNLYVGYYYRPLMFEPLLKASFFYLGALGLFELEYNEPSTPYLISAKEKPYISHWDGLEYVKITELGKYIFGLRKDYTYKKSTKKSSKIKFDEYKPIIIIDKSDILTQTKLEQFAQKLDENRYILDYAKLFKGVASKKALELKIKSFYKQIETNPPQVFHDFFNEVLQNANLLKKEPKQVVIKLQNSKKLLYFFMHNKKVQELVIKAEGYRIIVLKENIPKLTKILKENGFFVEFK